MIEHKTNAQLQKCIIQLSKRLEESETKLIELEEHTKRNLKICFSQIGHFEKRECRIMDRLIKVEKEVEEWEKKEQLFKKILSVWLLFWV